MRGKVMTGVTSSPNFPRASLSKALAESEGQLGRGGFIRLPIAQ